MSQARVIKAFVAGMTALVIVMNILANALPFFGNTTGAISNRYDTLFTPASITFSIWGLIYTLSVLFTLRFFTYDSNTHHKTCFLIAMLYGGLSVANITWLLLWHAELIGLSTVVLFIALGCAIALAHHYKSLSNQPYPLEKTFFTIYAAWLSVAAIANVAIALVASTLTLPFSPVFWTILVLIIATLLAIFASSTLNTQAFSAVIIWAFFGIALRHAPTAPNNERVILIVAIALSLLLISSFFINAKEKPAPPVN